MGHEQSLYSQTAHGVSTTKEAFEKASLQIGQKGFDLSSTVSSFD